ncbi:BMP8A protein, partial [Eudromia elegans]|nr:BMP8A protein [Eudromia elegans]
PGREAGAAELPPDAVPAVEQDRDVSWPQPYWKELRFDLARMPPGETVTAAELRIYKARGGGRPANGTLRVRVYEAPAELPSRESELLLLDVQDLRAGAEGWLVFDVTAAGNGWFRGRRHNVGLRLYVETEQGEGGSGRTSSFSSQTGRSGAAGSARGCLERAAPAAEPRPGGIPAGTPLVASRAPLPAEHGPAAEGRQQCRRHELYVSFQDLGWLDWVIAPQGYLANYCLGECPFPLTAELNSTNHAILQSLVHLLKPEAVPKACCAPTRLSATSVLYYDSNNNVILKKHRNMVVRSCGCH